MMTKEEIQKLTPAERVAGYMMVCSKLAMLGARLRKNGRQDETWTKEEEAEWDSVLDEIDPWAYTLTREERDLLLGCSMPIESFMSALTCGEWPPNK